MKEEKKDKSLLLLLLSLLLSLTPSSHMEVGCATRAWGTETAHPKPKQPEQVIASPTCNPATSTATYAERTSGMAQPRVMGAGGEYHSPRRPSIKAKALRQCPAEPGSYQWLLMGKYCRSHGPHGWCNPFERGLSSSTGCIS